MNILYDIFDLVDFPVVVTDSNMMILYKNHHAARYFGRIRKKSKITKYMISGNADNNFLVTHELEIDSGTPIKRALVICHEAYRILMFMPCLQFDNHREIVKKLNERFDGDIFKLYMADYKYHAEHKDSLCSGKRKISERGFDELFSLLHSQKTDSVSGKTERLDIATLIENIANSIGRSLAVLGLKMPSAKISPEVVIPCVCNVRSDYFLFFLYRVISIAFKLSSNGAAEISLNTKEKSTADICVSAHTDVSADRLNGNDISTLADILPEFSFELGLIKKYEFPIYPISVYIQDHIIKIHIKLTCASAGDSKLQSAYVTINETSFKRNVSAHTAKLKKALSQLIK